MGPGRHPQSKAEFLYFLGPEGFTYEYSFGARRIEDAAASVPRHSDFAKGYLVAGASIAAAVGAWLDGMEQAAGVRYRTFGVTEGQVPGRRGDGLLVEIDGCPFYIDDALDVAWRHDRFVLDGTAATRRASRCPAAAGLRFVTRSAGGLSPAAPVVSRPNGAPHGRVQACRNRLI
jgi:hypothetical protein